MLQCKIYLVDFYIEYSYSVRVTVLRGLHCHLILITIYEVGTIIIPKLRHRELNNWSKVT